MCVEKRRDSDSIPSSADTNPFSALAFLGTEPGPTQRSLLLLIMPFLETTTSFT
jgi:hypothetical protein